MFKVGIGNTYEGKVDVGLSGAGYEAGGLGVGSRRKLVSR